MINNDIGHHTEIFTMIRTFLVDIGNSLKNAFVGFVYNADGSVSSSFKTFLSYIIIAVSVAVIVYVTNEIIKIFRRNI